MEVVLGSKSVQCAAGAAAGAGTAVRCWWVPSQFAGRRKSIDGSPPLYLEVERKTEEKVPAVPKGR